MKKRLETLQKPQEAYSRNYYYASRQGIWIQPNLIKRLGAKWVNAC